jgi:hypothetical protein
MEQKAQEQIEGAMYEMEKSLNALDDCCEYCALGWCKNTWGSLCPHYLDTGNNSGGCEKGI